ncbi:MAG: hypothetical protein M3495_18000 [Pseudomonadota bacterium]|nr:hypothetical protein [Pseudomonadota bacterium]
MSIHGLGPEETRDIISQLRRGTETADFDVLCAQARVHLEALVAGGQVAEAFAWIDTLPPDARVVLKPFITHFSGAKTVRATANVTVDLVTNLLDWPRGAGGGASRCAPRRVLRSDRAARCPCDCGAEWDPADRGAPADKGVR